MDVLSLSHARKKQELCWMPVDVCTVHSLPGGHNFYGNFDWFLVEDGIEIPDASVCVCVCVCLVNLIYKYRGCCLLQEALATSDAGLRGRKTSKCMLHFLNPWLAGQAKVITLLSTIHLERLLGFQVVRVQNGKH